jgi:hypothetical protein
LLDALRHRTPPVSCPDMQHGDVWIERAAISRDFPPRQRP